MICIGIQYFGFLNSFNLLKKERAFMSSNKLRRAVRQKQMRFMTAVAVQGNIEEAAQEYMDALAAYRVAVFSGALMTIRKQQISAFTLSRDASDCAA
jgi:hypothetical protein